MITFVEHRECEVSHVKLWDEFLALILDEPSKRLLLDRGVEDIVSELRKGLEGRYRVDQARVILMIKDRRRS